VAGGQAGAGGSGAIPPPLGPTGTWTLAFHDEFDDTAGMSGPTRGLAASKWNSGWQSGPKSPGVGDIQAVTYPVQATETEYYGPAGVVFPGDGAVHLRMMAGVDNGGSFGGHTVESGMITTAGLMAINPGSVAVGAGLQPYTVSGTSVLEVRMRVPGPNAKAGAYWTGLWMTNSGNYGGTNPSGSAWPGGAGYHEEIDLIEWYNPGSTGANGRFHLHAASEYGGMSSAPPSLQNVDLSLAYHVYTYRFSTSAVELWVDGMPVTGVNPTAAQVAVQWASPQYVMLAFQAYAGASIPTSVNGPQTDMMIDYVRVWH
jgi:hypothetical protein